MSDEVKTDHLWGTTRIGCQWWRGWRWMRYDHESPWVDGTPEHVKADLNTFAPHLPHSVIWTTAGGDMEIKSQDVNELERKVKTLQDLIRTAAVAVQSETGFSLLDHVAEVAWDLSVVEQFEVNADLGGVRHLIGTPITKRK